MGQDDLPDRSTPRSSDQTCRGDRMMRSPKRPPRRQLHHRPPGEAPDLRYLDRLAPAERREDRRDSLREHRLAGARRTAQQTVVSACSRDNEGPGRVLLPSDVAQVRPWEARTPSFLMCAACWRKPIAGSAVQNANRAREMLDSHHIDSVDEFRLACARAGDRQASQPGAPSRLRHRHRAPGGPHRSIESQLSEQRMAVKPCGRELSARRQHRAGELCVWVGAIGVSCSWG